MKQKKCPQCKNLISIKAPTCLYCGRPNKFVTKDYINRKWNKEINNNNNFNFYSIITSKYLLFIYLFLVLLFILFN